MIIQIGTNDALSLMSRDIQDNLLKLKSLINEKLPQCKVGYQSQREELITKKPL